MTSGSTWAVTASTSRRRTSTVWRRALRRGHEVVLEPRAARRQTVDVRRLDVDAATAHVLPEVVAVHQEDVRRVLRRHPCSSLGPVAFIVSSAIITAEPLAPDVTLVRPDALAAKTRPARPTRTVGRGPSERRFIVRPFDTDYCNRVPVRPHAVVRSMPNDVQ